MGRTYLSGIADRVLWLASNPYGVGALALDEAVPSGLPSECVENGREALGGLPFPYQLITIGLPIWVEYIYIHASVTRGDYPTLPHLGYDFTFGELALFVAEPCDHGLHFRGTLVLAPLPSYESPEELLCQTL